MEEAKAETEVEVNVELSPHERLTPKQVQHVCELAEKRKDEQAKVADFDDQLTSLKEKRKGKQASVDKLSDEISNILLGLDNQPSLFDESAAEVDGEEEVFEDGELDKSEPENEDELVGADDIWEE